MDRQTDRRQYHASGRSYCVQQYDRLKMLGQHAMMLVRCREEIFMRRTTWYNSHRGNATLHTILRDNWPQLGKHVNMGGDRNTR